jgi:ATP-binding cassette subfamily C protein CydC
MGGISGPMLVGCLLATVGSFEAPSVLVRGLARFCLAAASAERLAELSHTPPRILDPAGPVCMPDAFDISVEAVSFAYEHGPLALDRVSLAVAEGQHVALKGPSGAGKSSLLHLMLRLADPLSGRIRIGGVDIRAVRQADLHRHVACLEQSAPIFLDTIRNNLTIAGQAGDAELWYVLEAARIADWVRGLPSGLDTVLAEIGSSISTGQARRLCLARTLLSPAPVLLLDEPTSGLDRETELAFLRDLHRAAKGRTVLLVTHADVPGDTGIRTVHLVPVEANARSV